MTEHRLNYDTVIAPQERPWDCGPASAQIILNSRGIVESEDNLIRDIGTTTRGTDDVSWVEHSFDRRLPQAAYTSVYLQTWPPTSLQKDVLWANIVQSINGGYGVVVNIDVTPANYPRGVKGSISPAYSGHGEVFHYIAAMGYDDDPNLRAVWIADPGFRPFGYWVSLDQLVTMIVPKGYAYASAASVAPNNDSVEAVMASNQEKFDQIHRETSTQQGPSRSFLATDGSNIDTPLGIAWNSDGNDWNSVMTWAYLFDVPHAVKVVEDVAKNGPYQSTWAANNPWLADFGKSYCQGLVKFKANLNKLFAK